MMTETKILILGRSGQLGRCLSECYPQARAVDRESFDLTEASHFKLLDVWRPQVVINCAAYTDVDRAEDEESVVFAVNAQAPKNLAHWCQKNQSLLIHYSTDYVFSSEHSGAKSELALTDPVNIYGQSKLKGEQYIQESGCEHIIIRTSWVFSEFGHNFVKSMLKLGQKHSKLKIVDDQRGGPTYARDLAQVTADLLQHSQKPRGLYHFCNSQDCSWYEFAKAIFDMALANQLLTQAPLLRPITTEQFAAPAFRPKDSRLDCQKIESFILPRRNWRQALEDCLGRL